MFFTLVTLQLMVCFETTESTGICKFAEMFPSRGCESCFQPKTTKEDRGSVVGPECSPNKVYGNCSSQRSCDDPTGQKMGSINVECLEPKTCICADGFLKNGDNCLTPPECGCYIADDDLIIAKNESYIDVVCSKKCICKNDQVICNTDYKCSSYATCRVETGVRRCYCNEGYEGDGETCTPLYKDCYDVYEAGQTQNGVYTILPRGWPGSPFNVYCDMTTSGGGWTVFQRRVDGTTDFYRNWTSYRNGFGSVQHGLDFWLGNEQLYYLTNSNQRSYKLRIDIVTSKGSPKYEEYASFRTDNEDTKYRLVDLGTHSGNSGAKSSVRTTTTTMNVETTTVLRDTEELGGTLVIGALIVVVAIVLIFGSTAAALLYALIRTLTVTTTAAMARTSFENIITAT